MNENIFKYINENIQVVYSVYEYWSINLKEDDEKEKKVDLEDTTDDNKEFYWDCIVNKQFSTLKEVIEHAKKQVEEDNNETNQICT